MGADFVFMHGGGQGGWVWAPTIDAMALQSGGNFGRSLALDAPGCGTKRGRDTDKIGFDEIIRELVTDIEAAGLTDVILVGHSQAGTVMPAMAQLRPELFRRLIYVSCIAATPGVPIPQMIGRGLHGESETEVGWPVDPATTSSDERYRIMFCNDMTTVQADRFVKSLGFDAWPMSSYTERNWRYDHLAAVPTTYVIFLRDRSLPPAWQERFAVRFHADRIIRIDAGHQGMVTRPQTLAEVLLAEAASE